MKKMRKALSIIFAVLMALGVSSVSAFAANTEAELDTVYTAADVGDGISVTFRPAESGKYVITSDNGGDEDIDPYVEIYDSEDNLISDDDDTETDYNFECVFEAEAGETYYIWLDAYDSDAVLSYEYIIKKYFDFTHQPTAAEPYVELTWDTDSDYQWYSASAPEAEITDKNADIITYDSESSSYSDENGWSGIPSPEYSGDIDFFTLPLSKGETISVAVNGRFDGYLGLWDYSEEEGYSVYSTDYSYITNSEFISTSIYELTAEKDGDYTIYIGARGIVNEVRAYKGAFEVTALEGETDSNLKAQEKAIYFCEIELEDGTVLTSDSFLPTDTVTEYTEVELDTEYSVSVDDDWTDEAVVFTPEESGEYVILSDNGGNDDDCDPFVMIFDGDITLTAENDDASEDLDFDCGFYAEAGETYYILLSSYTDSEYDYMIKKHIEIVHQPTDDEPYVELNWDDMSSDYEWYSAEIAGSEITDEDAEPFSNDGYDSYYDSDCGWPGIVYIDFDDVSEYDYFTIPLEEGETITVELLGEYYTAIGIYDYETDCGAQVEIEGQPALVELTAPCDGNFTVYAHGCGFEGLHIRAYKGSVEFTRLDDEENYYLSTEECGYYQCDVLCVNGMNVSSEIFFMDGIPTIPLEIQADNSVVNYKQYIYFDAFVDDVLPEGAIIEWTANNGVFVLEPYEDELGYYCVAESVDVGRTTVTAKILLEDGTYATDIDGEVISVSVDIEAKYSFWQWIIMIFFFGWIWY